MNSLIQIFPNNFPNFSLDCSPYNSVSARKEVQYDKYTPFKGKSSLKSDKMVYFLWNISFAIVHVYVKFSLRDKKFIKNTITEMKYNPSAPIFTMVEYSILIKQNENIPTIVEVMNQVPRLVLQALDHLFS